MDPDLLILQGSDIVRFTSKFMHALGPVNWWGTEPVKVIYLLRFGHMLEDRSRIVICEVGNITDVADQHDHLENGPNIFPLNVEHNGEVRIQIKLSVHHLIQTPGAHITTQCFFDPEALQLPDNVEILEGTHIFSKEAYDGVLRPLRKLIIDLIQVIVNNVEIIADLTDTSDNELSGDSS
ncbi:hypothetical protein MJO28_014904 [Puccinia striiformis f. sp. tritici]|uniref:Uncharacterized protein n=1 Tax=Puccinia striiformis f. sp. tritici TaxID=168172 RepID=A0ACC0DR19_9BASI|nr:hypothetical protein MJO28_014904 [Puccinia striiformis f. sp. tritici]